MNPNLDLKSRTSQWICHFHGGVGGVWGSPNSTYKKMQYRVDKSCSALAEARLKIEWPTFGEILSNSICLNILFKYHGSLSQCATQVHYKSDDYGRTGFYLNVIRKVVLTSRNPSGLSRNYLEKIPCAFPVLLAFPLYS